MVWNTLIGVALGGLIGWGGQVLHLKYQHYRDMKNLAGSLAGEMSALLKLLENRNFEQNLQYKIKEIRANPGQPIKITDVYYIIIEQDYLEIFKSNSGRIGLLGSYAKDVAFFYTITKGLFDMNAFFKPMRDTLFEGKELTGTRDSLADSYSEILRELSRLKEEGQRLLPILEKLNTPVFF